MNKKHFTLTLMRHNDEYVLHVESDDYFVTHDVPYSKSEYYSSKDSRQEAIDDYLDWFAYLPFKATYKIVDEDHATLAAV